MRALALKPLAAAALSVAALLNVHAQSRPAPNPAPSTLPSTPPTTVPPISAPALPATPAQSPAQRAQVSYVNGELTISASNSSLNQILRDISRLSGIKITGGVAEERVFGNYGPAPTNEVLRTLLDGTSSNMLYIQASGNNPSELILTTRTGGPTPPNPNAARFDDNADDEESSPRPPYRPLQVPVSGQSQSTPVPANAVPQPINPQPTDNNSNNTAAPPSDSNQQQSPNGVKTPQQIYEELQRLRQQQQQQQKPQ